MCTLNGVSMGFSLVLLNGPTPGAAVRLNSSDGPVTIGRDPSVNLPLDDHRCSRRHARVWFEHDRWLIEDCESRNGTLLNSQPIQRTDLEPGDLIRIGDRHIVFVADADGASASDRPSNLAASTFLARVSEPAKRELLLQRLRADADSRSLRDAAVLCRLAADLHAQSNVPGLMRLMSDTLTQATSADRVAVYLVGSDGRLRSVGPLADSSNVHRDAHVLASLAVANDEAILVQQGSISGSSEGEAADCETAISVPIPGRSTRRGAVECFRSARSGPFVREDLDLAIAIAFQVGLALENLEHREQLQLANQQLREAIAEQSLVLGNSPVMTRLAEQVARVAPTNATVLVVGESGTGKELVAEMIHRLSSRQAGPCVAVNCAAFSESLLEGELFGHEKGAFTGADRRRLGQFERSQHGTLFLDEIGEMSLACQAKLLRVLEGHSFHRVGGTEPIRADVRIVAATHRDLVELVRQKQFREDLFFRLHVIELRVPALRERGDDVLSLAGHFLERFRRQIGRGPARLSERAAAAISEYAWPGNVRELKNAIERAVVLGKGDEVDPSDLGIAPHDDDTATAWGLISLGEVERRHIQNVLDQVGGNKTRACEILGIGRATLYKKLSSYDR
jgi:DNA-binding NtrC family response regulator